MSHVSHRNEDVTSNYFTIADDAGPVDSCVLLIEVCPTFAWSASASVSYVGIPHCSRLRPSILLLPHDVASPPQFCPSCSLRQVSDSVSSCSLLLDILPLFVIPSNFFPLHFSLAYIDAHFLTFSRRQFFFIENTCHDIIINTRLLNGDKVCFSIKLKKQYE